MAVFLCPGTKRASVATAKFFPGLFDNAADGKVCR